MQLPMGSIRAATANGDAGSKETLANERFKATHLFPCSHGDLENLEQKQQPGRTVSFLPGSLCDHRGVVR